jgi:predicted DNA repair protein MutK
MALLFTVAVYGLVAGIVKLDDAGLWLSKRSGEGAWPELQRWLGLRILEAAPWLMQGLSIVGTAAMFLVGGGILLHGLPWLHELIHGVSRGAEAIPGIGVILAGVTPTLLNGIVGILAGALALSVVAGGQKVWRAVRPEQA